MKLEPKVVSNLSKINTNCLILVVNKSLPLQGVIKELDEASGRALSTLLKCPFYQEKNSCTFIPILPGCQAKHVLLVVFKSAPSEYEWECLIKDAVCEIMPKKLTDLTIYWGSVLPKERSHAWVLEQIVMMLYAGIYKLPVIKKSKKIEVSPLKNVNFLFDKSFSLTEAKNSIQYSSGVAQGINITKDLGNMPPNICNPEYLKKYCKSLAQKDGMSFHALGERQLEKLGMNCFLAVGQGSAQRPQLIEMHYKPAKAVNKKPIVLVGKGITFDTGGISIKPSSSMDEMKFDMCGAATVVGVMHTISVLKLPVHVIGLLAAAENMPDGTSYRPGDVLVSMSGQTVEVLNTDAEGRLVLCDTITYADKFKPEILVDMATLTGACIVALGEYASALYTNDDTLRDEFTKASQYSGDCAWPMPLHPSYGRSMNSPIADIANIGGRSAGSITAAYFLSTFVGKYKWAHLDIAGIASESGQGKQKATGRPVALLVEWLKSKATKS